MGTPSLPLPPPRLRRALLVVSALCAALAANAAGPPSIPSGMGPFRVELRSISSCSVAEKCSRPEKLEVGTVKVTKDPVEDMKYSTDVDFNLAVPVDERAKTEISVTRWNSLSNSFGNSIFKMSVPNPCGSLKRHRPDVFKQWLDVLYGGAVTDCPMAPVNARVKNFVVTSKIPSNVKSLPYGRYKSRMKLLDSSEDCIYCSDAVIDVLPKRHR